MYLFVCAHMYTYMYIWLYIITCGCLWSHLRLVLAEQSGNFGGMRMDLGVLCVLPADVLHPSHDATPLALKRVGGTFGISLKGPFWPASAA